MNECLETYVTSKGVILLRRYQYASAAEWDMLYALSRASGMSLGKMQITLAKDFRDELKLDLKTRLRDIS